MITNLKIIQEKIYSIVSVSYFQKVSEIILGTAFVEIKDCKAKNISVYKDKVKSQIISTVQIFRDKGIIEGCQRVYGIISFPRRNKASFNQTIFDDVTEYKKLYKKYRISFFPTNDVFIVNEKKLTAQ